MLYRSVVTAILCFMSVGSMLAAEGEPRTSSAAASGAMGLRLIEQKIANLEKKRAYNEGRAEAYRKESERLQRRNFGHARSRLRRARYYEEVATETDREIERLETLLQQSSGNSQESAE